MIRKVGKPEFVDYAIGKLQIGRKQAESMYDAFTDFIQESLVYGDTVMLNHCFSIQPVEKPERSGVVGGKKTVIPRRLGIRVLQSKVLKRRWNDVNSVAAKDDRALKNLANNLL